MVVLLLVDVALEVANVESNSVLNVVATALCVILDVSNTVLRLVTVLNEVDVSVDVATSVTLLVSTSVL